MVERICYGYVGCDLTVIAGLDSINELPRHPGSTTNLSLGESGLDACVTQLRSQLREIFPDEVSHGVTIP